MAEESKALAPVLLACLMAGAASPLTRSVVLLIAAWSGSAASEVILDGSLGGARGPLPGPDFEIGADLGRRVGSNLFHSFGAFNLSASESATFSGPNAIENVLGRVTGGSGSSINGLLRSTIPDANLFLLNPAGIVFGSSARLDVQGSFHAGTGDFIRLADGRQFDAVPSAKDALLSTAPPQAFGFLGRQNPAPIEVNGTSLRVPDGEALSLIGGDIQVRGAQLVAPAGRVNLASVGATAEVTLGPDDLGVEPRSRGGAVTLSGGSLIDTSGEGGGSVFIRGGEFVMDRSEVRSVTLGSKHGGVVSIEAKQVELQNGARIGTIAMGSGRAGNVLVEADRVSLSGDESPSRTGLPGGIGSVALSSGAAGTVAVKAKDLEVCKGAAISTLTFFRSGRAGNVLVEADRVSLSGDGGIRSAATGRGAAGTVTVKAGDLEIRNRAVIETRGFGRGGNVGVEAHRVSLSGDGTFSDTGIFTRVQTDVGAGKLTVKAGDLKVRHGARIAATTFDPFVRDHQLRNGGAITTATTGFERGGDVLVEADRVFLSGDGALSPTGIGASLARLAFDRATGTVTIKAGELQVHNGATISSATMGFARGGDIFVKADNVLLSGDGSRIDAATLGGPGPAGLISLTTGSLTIRDGGQISASTEGLGKGGSVTINADHLQLSDGSGIRATTSGEGPGGKLSINATTIELRDGSSISSQSLSERPDAGRSGDVFIRASDSFRLFNDSQVSVETERAHAGDIDLDVGSLLHLRDSSITTSVAGGRGDGGNIRIDPVFTVLDGGSRIIANARRGDAGNIRIVSDFFFASPDSIVRASNDRNIQGVVDIDSPETDLNAGLVPLPASFFDATEVLMRPCAERSGADVIRLVLRPYEVLPDSPYALRVQRPNAPPGASGRERGERGMATPAPLALGCLDGD